MDAKACKTGETRVRGKCVLDVTIYDDGGKTVDRYTVILRSGSVFGMSSDPFSPQGFNQYVGEIEDFPKGLKHTGRKLKQEEIPKIIKLAIKDRIAFEKEGR